jgi:hypothetical protein
MPNPRDGTLTIDPGEAYSRIFAWLRTNEAALRDPGGERSVSAEVLRFLRAMPDPRTASDSDRDLVFTELLSGYFETFYNQRDEHSTALFRYAEAGLSKYPKGSLDESCSKSIRLSSLYPLSFGHKVEVDVERWLASRDQSSSGRDGA